MPVIKKEDGSVSIRSKGGETVFGKMVSVSNEELKQKYEQWIEDCTKLVTPDTNTFKETERYFLDQCDTIPMTTDNMHMKSYKYSIITNYCRDRLEHQVSDFSFDMTDEEMEKWHEENSAMHREVINSPLERFGLIVRGYLLPKTEHNNIFYKDAYAEMQKHMEHSGVQYQEIEMPDICFFFEETNEDIQASGGGRHLMNQLIAFRGISQEDIDNKTLRFLSYINALREIGKLPDYKKMS